MRRPALTRRELLERVTGAATVAGAAIVTLPIVGYLLAPVFARLPEQFVAVAKASDLAVGTTTLVHFRDPSPLPWAGQTAETALWVRRLAESGDAAFQVFDVNCTHLGCPLNWRAEAKIFLCPCHGGVFYADGTVAGGPPQRPMYQREWRVEGGELRVRAERLATPRGRLP